MKTPKRIQPLVEEGLVDTVIRQLMSGKEAAVYVVRCGDDIRCAKVYKDANQRSFRQAVAYQEGRKVKNSRQARAMEKGSRYGRKMQEEVWQNAEVDALYRLGAAGVRVPQAYICFEGVLLMELVTDADGNAAPRLNDVELTEALALDYHAQLLHQVVLMLCAGVIHGDLSEYNILIDGAGPVIIDLPQAVDAAGKEKLIFDSCRMSSWNKADPSDGKTRPLDAEPSARPATGNARGVGIDCRREHLGGDQRRSHRRLLEGRADCARAGELCARALARCARLRGCDCVVVRVDAAPVGSGSVQLRRSSLMR